MRRNLSNVRFSVIDEIEKSAIKVCSTHDRTTTILRCDFSYCLRDHCSFLTEVFVCAGVYAVSSCYLQTYQPVTNMGQGQQNQPFGAKFSKITFCQFFVPQVLVYQKTYEKWLKMYFMYSQARYMYMHVSTHLQQFINLESIK